MNVNDRDERERDLKAIRFGDFELSLRPLELSKSGHPVELRLLPLRLLALLAGRSGDLVTHEELKENLWNGRQVSFSNSIHVYVSQVRAALQDDAGEPTFLENVPRQGYRFLQKVEYVYECANVQSPVRLISRRFAWAGLCAILAIALLQYLDLRKTAIDESTMGGAADSYQRGIYLLDRRDPASTEKSLRYFKDALSMDPQYALAHVGAARAHGRLGKFDEADRQVTMALEMDDSLADAYIVAGLIDVMHSWSWDAAVDNFRVALALDDANAVAHQGIATYYALQGDIDSGIAHMRRARQLDPASTIILADFGWFYYFAGNYEKAADICTEALDLEPLDSDNRNCVIRSLSLAGNHSRAVDHIITYMEQIGVPESEIAAIADLDPAKALFAFDSWRMQKYLREENDGSSSFTKLAFAAASIGDFEHALAYVDQAILEKDPFIPFVAIDPVFSPVHDHPKFKEILEKLRLAGS